MDYGGVGARTSQWQVAWSPAPSAFGVQEAQPGAKSQVPPTNTGMKVLRGLDTICLLTLKMVVLAEQGVE